MSGFPYLEPEDVAPENARLVLDFLNAVTTPQEIADAVEIVGDPDVGVRLGRRILDARARIGRFTDLTQVRVVPLIGPERFTEIVVSLSAQPLPIGIPGLFTGDFSVAATAESAAAAGADRLALELAELRARIDRIGAAASDRRLTVRTVRPNAFLGQDVTIVATLIDGGRPAVDVPVSFVATRGTLRANDGRAVHEGHLVTARTTFDGTVRLDLIAATREALSPLQHAALAAQLATLDANAHSPAAIEDGLRNLAHQYAWEINLPFRQAVDILVRDFRPMLLDTVNVRVPLLAWSHHDAAVLAFAPVDGNGAASSVSATAALHVRVKDWLAPFLDVFLATSRAESTLGGELRDLTQQEPDAARLVTAIYDRAGAYVASRYGKVGSWVGRKVAESSIRGFLDTDLATLPLDARVDVFPALDTASRTIASTDTAVIQGLVGTRKDIERTVDRRTGGGVDLGALGGRIGVLEQTVATLPRADALDGLRAELSDVLGGRIGALEQTVATLPRADALDGLRAELSDVLGGRIGVLEQTVATLPRTDALDGLRTELQNALAATRQQLTSEIAAIRTDVVADFDAVRQQIAADLAGVRAQLTADLDDVRQEFAADIGSAREELSAQIAGQVAGVRQQVTTDIAGVRAQVTADLDGVRQEFAADIGSVRSQVTADLDGVRQEFAAGIGSAREELSAQIAGQVAGVRQQVSTDLAGVRTEIAADLDGVRQQIARDVGTARQQLGADLEGMRRQLVDATNALDARVRQLRTDVDQLRPRLEGLVTRAALDEAIATRVTQTELTQALAGRVTQTELTQALAGRVTQTELTQALAGRVTQTELTQALAGRVTQTELTQALEGRVTQTDLNRALADKADVAVLERLRGDVDRKFVTVEDQIRKGGRT
jgi:hypothetical protein